jgi:hypothetical protein
MSVRVELSGKKVGKNNPSQQKMVEKMRPDFSNMRLQLRGLSAPCELEKSEL